MAPSAAFCPNDGTRLNSAPYASSGATIPQPAIVFAPKKRGFVGKSIAVVVGLFVLLAVIGSFAGHAPTEPPSDAALHASRPVAGHPKQRSPHVVLSVSGSGINTTKKFAVSDDWDLAWTYDCSDFGNSGNFIIQITGADVMRPEAGTNELGARGSGTEHLHGGAGYRYLEMNSECNWEVKAISL